MKSLFTIISLIALLSSCQNNFDVKVTHSDGTVCKFKCKNGKDTATSIRYCYYKSFLLSKTTFINGKREGSVIDYYPNGRIRIITNYQNDKADGINKVFNEDGELIRRSLYIDDKQVLFESIMVNTEDPIKRRKLVTSINHQIKWAGELYTNLNDELIAVAKLNIGEYQGMYVKVIIDDTLYLEKETIVKLEVTFPAIIPDSKITIGEFDKTLTCIDTLVCIEPDSLEKSYSFRYTPKKTGNDYIIGNLTVPHYILKDTIYFFKGFYVKK